MSSQPIVWIDRNLDYSLLVKRVFRRNSVQNPIVTLTNGELALSYLGTTWRRDYSFPLLVVSEVSPPEIDGFGVLSWIKATPKLARIPVLLLGEQTENNVKRASDLGAGFLAKPLESE